MKKNLSFLLPAQVSLCFLLIACGSKYDALQTSADQAVAAIPCASSKSHLFDVMYASLIDLQDVPTTTTLRGVFEKVLDQHPEYLASKDEFLNLISEFYEDITPFSADSPKELLKKVAAAEIGDQSNPEAKVVQERLQAFQSKWQSFVSAQSTKCVEPSPEIPSTLPPNSTTNPVVFGARKTLATAYQSCTAIDREPMTADTPNVSGISVIGHHPDGIGLRRVVGNINQLLQSDYYLEGVQIAKNCKNVRASPLIYDYGGKPLTTSAANSSLDLFQNAGTGTTALGIDCSAYVFSSIASAGLKLSPTTTMKAVLVNGISSTMFMNPAANGLSCFDKVKMGISGTLKAGDIIAQSGHVVIVESVGADPLGITAARTSADCNKLTISNVDFVVAQSSPSKNGIGINKYVAKDFLREISVMAAGIQDYQRAACQARLLNQDQLMQSSHIQAIRHNLSASCLSTAVPLAGEACVGSCPALN